MTSHILSGKNPTKKQVNVEYIVKNHLCIGCGVCEAACPNDAVKVVFDEKSGMPLPIVNDNLCNGCRTCLKVCYGYRVDNGLKAKIYTSPTSILGNLTDCYVGYAYDKEFRSNCTSGGVVSAILTHAFARGLIDGAIVTKMESGDPPKAKAFIATTTDEVFSARGSKYCPVSLAKCLKNLENRKKYAVVGLPCHIYGMRRLAETNAKIRNSVSIYLGILCGGMPSYLGTLYILHICHMEKHYITKFEYRGGGWPGRLLIQGKQSLSNQHTEISISYPEYWHNTFGYFIPYRCTLCHDGFNEFSDVSFGDAWLPEFASSKNGLSLVIVRTDMGRQLVLDSIQDRIVKIDPINLQDAERSQRGLTHLKFRTLRARLNLCKALKRELPIFDMSRSPPAKFSDYLSGIDLYFGRILASRSSLWRLLNVYASANSLLDYLRKKMARVKNKILRYFLDQRPAQLAVV